MPRTYKRQLTLWYPGTVKPERVGPYQISGQINKDKKHSRGGNIYYAYWDGSQWGMVANKPDVAKMLKARPNPFQTIPWRGRTAP